jgi:HEAT repeat protein
MKDRQPQAAVETPSATLDAAAVERVLKAMAKLVAGRKIYAANNPRLAQFREELAAALREFFSLEDELVLTIEQFSIHWREHAVYENLRRDESLAFILFKDGIGEVTFLPAAIGAETDRLVGILADELHHLSNEEDVVTRFWNADFQHITYRVLDDYLEPERDSGDDAGPPGIEETADQDELIPSLADKGRVIVHRSESLVSLDALLREVSRRHHPGANPDEAELAYQRLLRSAFSVPVDEMEMYRGELDREHADDGIAAFFETLYVFLLMPDNPTGVRDVSSVLERLLEFTVTERRPATLTRLIGCIREFDARADLPESARRVGEKLLARAGSAELVGSFLDGLADADASADAVVAYAIAVGAPATDALVRALHRGASPSIHRRICDALIAISPEAVASIIDRLDVDQPEVAVDAVYLARALKLETLSPRLRELVFYPDARVKLEMLGWIATHHDADTTNLLLASLGDLDRRVRLRVLDALSERREPRVRERLTELACAKDLGERHADEQEAIFKTLGQVGDAGTVVQLRALIDRRRLIHIGKGPDLKLLALRALERIHDPSAVALLARLCQDPSDAVKLRAQRAHQALVAAMAGAPAASAGQGAR